MNTLWSMESVKTEGMPFLRWAGSKRQLVPVLREYWNDSYDRYVEPFAGSCTLFFALRPDSALLADKNEQLIEVYEVVRTRWRSLHEAVTTLPRCKKTYDGLRCQEPSRLSAFRRAVRFVYLNRHCFNGLYRTNLAGRFNVPYSPRKTGRFPSTDVFEDCAEQLRRADLRPWDFGTTLRHTREGDFVYMDPPYAVDSRRVFREYGPKHFGEADLARLGIHLEKLHAKKVVFLLSYADCAAVRTAFGEWHLRRVRVRRNIAGFQGARRHAYELLVSNRPHR